jgi:ABC-type bacteriocin/lantibiotic exporter with double-glycine peptidase domain
MQSFFWRQIAFVMVVQLACLTNCFTVFKGEDSREYSRSKSIESVKPTSDVICGPRCVKYILDYYKYDSVEISELAREMQWPEIEKGASLNSLTDSLEKRGVFTFALSISNSAKLIWPDPVIVHYGSQARDNIGHYVVWLPESSESEIVIWNGNEGIQYLSQSDWMQSRSGAILLTSSQPINNPYDAIQYSGLSSDGTYPMIFGAVVLACGLLSVFYTHHYLKKEKES